MKLLALIFPCGYFISEGEYTKALSTFLLQATFLGWIPAAMWAHYTWECRNNAPEKDVFQILTQVNSHQ